MDMTTSTATESTMMHDHSMAHPELYDLVDHIDATHVAVNSGSWFDPNTWAEGVVPGDDARVVIEVGVTVTYDDVSDARLFTVRVDGELNFATDADTQMVVDTMVVDATGALFIGTQDNPVQSDVETNIIIANNGAIDVNWDPTLLSRGIIALGHVEMHGQEKLTHLKVAEDPAVGDTSITLAGEPTGWEVGDKIVIAGTHYDGYKWDGQKVSFTHNEDEVVTISSIDGNTVHFETALEFDHDAPRDDLKTSVANYTRNVSIESENAEVGEIHERGHVMFMHNDDVDVRYVEFYELGRTDKSETALNDFEFENIMSDSNVKGRYSLHLHRAGVDDIEDPAMLVGNAVFGSPGWGYVHHDSNAVLDSNASYDTFGAGFVAETGNETGTWSNNIAIFAQGISWADPKLGNDVANFDMGKTGSGFYFQGRMVDAVDNVAASTNTGFTYFHRGREENLETGLDGKILIDPDVTEFSDAFYQNGLTGDDLIGVAKVPIRSFIGNETIASKTGVFVQKGTPEQGHDIRTIMQDFTAWEVMNGADIAYTSHYLLENFDVVGKTATQWSKAGFGIKLGTNSSDVTIVDARIEGFVNGFDIANKFTTISQEGSQQHIVVEPIILNVENDYRVMDLSKFQILSHDDLVHGRFEINLDGDLTFRGTSLITTGTKTDSAGDIALPAGTDNFDISRPEVVGILENDGYFTADNGKNYFVLKNYYSDRVTGEVFKTGNLIEIGASIDFSSPYAGYDDAKYNGTIDLNSTPPVVADETAGFHEGETITVDLLANDSDADGDAIYLDGIVQPLYGRVTDNGDGTITYKPYINFSETETVKYWVTDGYGNFSEGFVTFEALGDSDAPVDTGTGTDVVDEDPIIVVEEDPVVIPDDPQVTEPDVAQVEDPVITEPEIVDPILIEPVDPVVTDPVATEPEPVIVDEPVIDEEVEAPKSVKELKELMSEDEKGFGAFMKKFFDAILKIFGGGKKSVIETADVRTSSESLLSAQEHGVVVLEDATEGDVPADEEEDLLNFAWV